MLDFSASSINNINGVGTGSGTSNATLAINFTADAANLTSWALSVYDSNWGLMQNWVGNTINISAVETYTATANGTYYANLTVIDSATSTNTTSFMVYVDQTAPLINSLSIGSITTGGAVLTVNASDDYSGISNCTYSGAGSGSLTLSSGLYTASLSGLSASTAYTLNVTCYDTMGYSASNATSFTTAAVAQSSGGSNNGGGSTGGGSSGGSGGSSSTKQTDTVNVNIGIGRTCAVTITREMSSSTSLSVLTTTLENVGGNGCSLTNFVFADTIPADFPALDQVTFNPQYTSREGWTVSFMFPTFAAGESKTLTYSANQWIRTSLAKNFTAYTMTATKQQATSTIYAANGTATPIEEQTAWIPTPLPVLPLEQPAAQPTQAQTGAVLASAMYADILGFPWWVVIVILVVLGASAAGIYWKVASDRRNKRKNKR